MRWRRPGETGDSWTVVKGSRCVGVTRAQALDALRRQVPACTHRRADTALGFMEQAAGRAECRSRR
ncbi:DUF6233 domain-containing protein [Streptomyces sp. CA-106131]|uniref:DUF6233 domain-containing protein n=1 Tax=Streptomyces sp. CA-106131 TaxID=3240045 RepID=UPI003D8BCBDA